MFRTSESIKEIAAALAKAQAKFPAIPKDKEVEVRMKSGGTYKYKYAELSSIIEATRPSLSENCLSFVQHAAENEKGMTCITRLLHSSGEWIENEFPIIAKEADMQGVGGALTFSRRYGLTALIGVAAEEDTDGDGANRDKDDAKKGAGKKPPAEKKDAAPPAQPPPPPPFFEAVKAPLSAIERMNLGRYVFLGGKFKGKKLGDVSQNDIMSYRNDIYAEFPEGGPNPMPRAAQDILNRINAFYFDQIK